MKKMIAIAGTLVLVTGVFAAFSAFWLTGAVAQEPRGQVDVVMMRCATGSAFEVKAYEGSANAPSKKTGSCPETVALLIQDGFSVENVGYFDQDDKFIAYTLVRAGGR